LIFKNSGRFFPVPLFHHVGLKIDFAETDANEPGGSGYRMMIKNWHGKTNAGLVGARALDWSVSGK
jgi:hypothetical protein